MFQTIEEVKQYINVSKYLDINILKPYIETALNEKIRPLVGDPILQKLEEASLVLPAKEVIYGKIKIIPLSYDSY